MSDNLDGQFIGGRLEEDLFSPGLGEEQEISADGAVFNREMDQYRQDALARGEFVPRSEEEDTAERDGKLLFYVEEDDDARGAVTIFQGSDYGAAYREYQSRIDSNPYYIHLRVAIITGGDEENGFDLDSDDTLFSYAAEDEREREMEGAGLAG